MLLMIKDRGNIKWTSLMLTEHREKLRELYERDKDIEKPVLDEQQLEKLDSLIREVVQFQAEVKIFYYENHRIRQYEGRISLKGNYLYLDNKRLVADNIIDIIIL